MAPSLTFDRKGGYNSMKPIERSDMKSVFHDYRYGGHFLRLVDGDMIFVSDSDAIKHGSPMKAANVGHWSYPVYDIQKDSYFKRMEKAS